MAKDDDDDYKIGFGKPPAWSRFKRGRSGNPNGRPKGRKNASTILHNACNEKIKVKGPDGTKYITKFEAATIQLLNKAASGDLKATKEVYRLKQSMPDPSPGSCTPVQINFIKPKPEHTRNAIIEGHLLKRTRRRTRTNE
jgi:hypothetical protein